MEMVSVLLEAASAHGVGIKNRLTLGRGNHKDGWTLLAVAAEKNRVEVVKRLLQEEDVLVDAAGYYVGSLFPAYDV